MKKKSKPTKSESGTKESPKKPKRRSRKGTNWKSIFMVSALVLVMIAFIFSSMPANFTTMKSNKPVSQSANSGAPKKAGPEFKKEGSLQFLKADGSAVGTNIEIEVADSEYQRAQGLMYRRYMADNHGMLFIMEAMETQSFYMRNTYIPLDIIYVDDQKRIVSIQKNTVPLSEESLFSEGPALYVVEVNAGYCDQYGIGPGDQIAFTLD